MLIKRGDRRENLIARRRKGYELYDTRGTIVKK
jgi:hypothetical protein